MRETDKRPYEKPRKFNYEQIRHMLKDGFTERQVMTMIGCGKDTIKSAITEFDPPKRKLPRGKGRW